MTTEISFFAALLIGLAGGVHCLGMCGGITVALQSAVPQGQSAHYYTLNYHFGRIFSYTLAGGLTGFIGSIISSQIAVGISLLSLLSALLLILLACYIGNWYRGLSALERMGAVVWRRIQPLASRFLPFSGPLSAFGYGAIWGWLPCGLVYSTLSWSLASGSWANGASIMLAFGLGTLPAMLAVSFGAQSVRQLFQQAWLRQCVAIGLMLYGIYLLFQFVINI